MASGEQFSPDGQYKWNGSEWIPVGNPSPNISTDVKDSVITGDVISHNTTISSDAEVIKAAMDGVVQSMKIMTEQNSPQNILLQPQTSIPNNESQRNNNHGDYKSIKPVVVGLLLTLLIGVAIVAGYGLWVSNLVDETDNKYSIIGTWETGLDGGVATERIQLLANQTFIYQFKNSTDEVEISHGTWVIGAELRGSSVPLLNLTDNDSNESILLYFQLNENSLVLYKLDSDTETCEIWIRFGFGNTNTMVNAQIKGTKEPDFCEI